MEMPEISHRPHDTGQHVKRIKARKERSFRERKKLRRRGGEGLEICKSAFFH